MLGFIIAFILWRIYKRKKDKEDIILQENHFKSLNKAFTKLSETQSKLRSNAVRYGQKFEQMIPFAKKFGFNMKDVRFLGSPIDMVIFDGLDEGNVKEVVFVEVKTGKSGLSKREKMVKDCIIDKRVRWEKMTD